MGLLSVLPTVVAALSNLSLPLNTATTATTMAPTTTPSIATSVLDKIDYFAQAAEVIPSFIETVSLISSYYTESQKTHEDIASRTTFNQTSFDFIVVGAGAAGSVIASRLSENPAVRVLLLEAGGGESVLSDTPAMDELISILPTELPKYTTYYTVPQKIGGQGFINQQVAIVTGSVLGGGTTINGMMYNRGGANDFNGWAKDYGCTNWAYEDVLPYFIKSENNTDQAIVAANPGYHGTSGPLTISSLNESQMCEPYRLVTDTLLTAYTQVGNYGPTDYNAKNPIGTTVAQRNIKNGKRQSTSTAFLEPVYKSRPNLQILTGATVTKVNFDGTKATGVTFEFMGQTEVANVTREVILSAGAINSPKILMLSGVGPAEELEELGIEVVADLPVGENFQDHVRVGGLNFNVDKLDYTYWTELFNPANWLQRGLDGSGPLSNDLYLHQPSFLNVRTNVTSRNKTFGPSDLFLAPSLAPVPFVSLSFVQHQLDPLLVAEYYGPNFFKPQLNLYVTLNYCTSRGTVKLNSTNPADPPIVDPAYFSDPNGDDLARAVDGFKLGLELVNTPAFKAIGAKLFNTTVPGCEDFTPYSDDYIECIVKTLSSTELHPCCSVRMAGDKTAVVDPRVKVIGVQGLRVADASIMPFDVTANPTAAIIMIGEKASCMILQDNQLPTNNCP